MPFLSSMAMLLSTASPEKVDVGFDVEIAVEHHDGAGGSSGDIAVVSHVEADNPRYSLGSFRRHRRGNID